MVSDRGPDRNNRIVAIPNRDGTYYLDPYTPSDTYHARERIKDAGGRWDGRHWIVTDDQRQALGFERLLWVMAEGCHIPAPERFLVRESKAVSWSYFDGFCSLCDSHARLKITAVLGTDSNAGPDLDAEEMVATAVRIIQDHTEETRS